ncbi:MAG TPA: excinuclease ABC subunit UvrA [Labilithrix sp.]|nr:excinuclease ABC subunit UvrA [Labilithrix sp.]
MLPIRLRGARTHNLRGVDLDLPPGQLVALTGPSGAGKSSLALDTLYAEGQRRFVESFSPYARQFLERLERPPVGSLEPVAATVAVDRRAPVKSSRSTVATLTDLEPYLAALFACEAVPTCPDCHETAVATTAHDAAVRAVSDFGERRAVVSYPVRVESAEAYLELRESLVVDGYRRLVVGGAVREIDDVKPSEAGRPDVALEVVIDRLKLGASDVRRLQQAIEIAWERGHGRAELRTADPPKVEAGAPFTSADGAPPAHVAIARGLVCPSCARSFDPPRPGLFSYNSPLGACTDCRGFGRVIAVDWDKVIPDKTKTLEKGAIKAWSGKSSAWEREVLVKFARKRKIPLDVPWESLSEAQRAAIIDGEGDWAGGKYPGIKAWFKWLEGRTYKMHVRVFLSRYRDYVPCALCNGARLNATARTYLVGGLDLGGWHRLTVEQALERLRAIAPSGPQGKRVKGELASRLAYLDAVGLSYLTLDRQARTLSGGEAQRASLTTALGASLTGTLFVLDEPTVGLHATDVPRLADAMRDLSKAGNTVLVIEHDRGVVERCDRVVEMGPGAGPHGGNILFQGTPAEIAASDTATGRAWRTRPRPRPRTEGKAKRTLSITGIRENNLRIDRVEIPLGVLCAITGPSGSGKSTLAEDIVYRGVARACGTAVAKPGVMASMKGHETIKSAVLVDQSPLGRTARGNAATYTHAWDRVRARFAAEAESLRRGLSPAHFSFNVPGKGRCENCSGEGYETVEMQFLADVMLLCPVCQGKRFNPDVLSVRHAGKTVADVLAMTVDEAIATFSPPQLRDYVIENTLTPLVRVGLGYLPLGQPLSTLSGGEAQRLKLARALSSETRGALFVVDEPSAGLHAADAEHVVSALRSLVEEGASVVMVEHDLSVVREADWVIDLGPGSGPHGGVVVAEGTPERIAASGTKTGEALRELEGKSGPPKGKKKPASAAAAASTPATDHITVQHAREHNLKDVSCRIPHGKLCVVTGPSGSGKSSLAFDVIFAEGQRRFMETLTPYARQFLPTLPRPDVDLVSGVPPSIALEQRTTRGGANSTVATVTEIAHYLRLLYAKVGELYCPDCNTAVQPSAPDDMFARVRAMGSKSGKGSKSGPSDKRTLYAPAVRARKGTYLDLFTNAARAGVTTARVDGAIVSIDPPPKLTKAKEHTIDLIVYYGPLAELDRAAFDRALAWGAGSLRVGPAAPTHHFADGEEILSTSRACPQCGTGIPELDPRWFSFNTKQGQCGACEGTGLRGGSADMEDDADPGKPRERCRVCKGDRLAPIPRSVRLGGETYPRIMEKSVTKALAQVSALALVGNEAIIAKAPLAELKRRLEFVEQVGLGYLGLGRAANGLSGGEMQRLRLSAQLGSGLTGALYVLDEPTIGLHPRDTGRLIANLRALVDTGSTVIVVEHDAETIQAADHLTDLGPGGGRNGGHIVAEGTAAAVLASEESPTGRALREPLGRVRPPRPMADAWLELEGARANNLKDVTFRVPAGRMVVVAGVSGSGKSTLVQKVFFPALRRSLKLVSDTPGAFKAIRVPRTIKRALAVDQSPIGRTPRSVPATFLGIWDEIRKLFAALPEARARGWTPARFSFNTPQGGRCTACDGQGVIVSEMAFLPEVSSPCETCLGMRFEPSTLDVKWAGLSIGDILKLSAEEAAEVFGAFRKIAGPLRTITELGCGYLSIGQGSNTLSGGEAQRLKLASELTAGMAHEPTVYVLDEPTTGLHLSDVGRLVKVLDRLVERGDTLVIVEHHPDVIANADWVVELGPEAGDAGGTIVFEGDPAQLRKKKTATGRALGKIAAAAAASAP